MKLLTIHREMKGVPVDIVFHDDGTLELISDYDVEPDIAAEALGLGKSDFMKLIKTASYGWLASKHNTGYRESEGVVLSNRVRQELIDSGMIGLWDGYVEDVLHVTDRPPGPWQREWEKNSYEPHDASWAMTYGDIETLYRNLPRKKDHILGDYWPQASGLDYWPVKNGFLFEFGMIAELPSEVVANTRNKDNLSENLLETLDAAHRMGYEQVVVFRDV